MAGGPILAVAARDSQANRQVKCLDLVAEWLGLDQETQTLGELEAAFQWSLRHDHGELLAAVAGDQVALTNGPLDACGEISEGNVAGQVAHLVIDRLKAIQVNHGQR